MSRRQPGLGSGAERREMSVQGPAPHPHLQVRRLRSAAVMVSVSARKAGSRVGLDRGAAKDLSAAFLDDERYKTPTRSSSWTS